MNDKTAKVLRFAKHDRVVAAVAQPANGPGWSNTPLWVFIQNGVGEIRRECLQPEEQPTGIRDLYPIAALVHAQMLRAMGG